MALNPLTLDKRSNTAKDWRNILAGVWEDGVVAGCGVAFTANSVTVADGYFIMGGAVINNDGAETISVTPEIAAGYVRLRCRIDLTREAGANGASQTEWALDYSATAVFPALTQEDIRGTGRVYEAEIAVLQIVSGNLSALTRSMPAAVIDAAKLSGILTAESVYVGDTLLSTQNANGRLYVGSQNNATVASGGGSLLLQTYDGSGTRYDGITLTPGKAAVTGRLYVGETLLSAQNGDGRLYVGSAANGTVVSGGETLLLQTYDGSGTRYGGITLTPEALTAAETMYAEHILPTETNGWHLGSSDLRWKSLYAAGLNLTGDATVAGNVTANHIRPRVTDGYHLGSSDLRWKTLYAVGLDLTGNAAIAGSATVGGGATVTGSIKAGENIYIGETLLAVQNTGDGRLYVGGNANGTVVSGSGSLLLQTYSSNGARRDGISITADEVTRIYSGGTSASITLQGKETQCRNYDNTAYAPLSCSVVNESSSLRYKDVTGNMTDEEADKLLSVEVKEFTYRSDEEKTPHFGVIAEQLDEIGLTSLVAYDEEGRPDAVGYSRIAPYLINLVQRQQKRIEALEARLTALEGRNG